MSKRKGAADSEELGGVPAERSLSPQLAGRKCESSDADADADARSRKRAKRKQARKAKSLAQADEEDVDEEAQVNLTVGRMDPGLLSDRMARQIKRFEPSLTPVELGDLMIPQRSLTDTTTWSTRRTADGLPAFIEQFARQSRKDLSKAPSPRGAPHTLVICPTALRAANVVRVLRCYQTKEAAVAKLFAKHIKLEEAVKYSKETRMSLGVGTPQRLSDLVDAEALSLQNLDRIVLDGSWSGPKKRTIFEMAEALVPTARFLARREVRARVEPTSNATQILVY